MNWQAFYPDPVAFAQGLWDPEGPLDFDKLLFLDLSTVVELARIDSKIYDQLHTWARTRSNLNDATKALLFDLFIYEKPKAKAMRDNRLRYIAKILEQSYGVRRSRNEATIVKSVTSILSQLPGAPNERSLERILRAQNQAE